MRKSQKGFGVIETLLVFVFFAAIVAAAVYVLSNQTRVSINNDSTTFSFDMGSKAEPKRFSDSTDTPEYYSVKLSDYDTKIVATAYVPKNTIVKGDIYCSSQSFKVNILGSQHLVCNQKNLIYAANFNNKGKWYQATVFAEDNKTEVNQATIVTLLESLKIE
jgi:Tfp pilus assembly protein PilV